MKKRGVEKDRGVERTRGGDVRGVREKDPDHRDFLREIKVTGGDRVPEGGKHSERGVVRIHRRENRENRGLHFPKGVGGVRRILRENDRPTSEVGGVHQKVPFPVHREKENRNRPRRRIPIKKLFIHKYIHRQKMY